MNPATVSGVLAALALCGCDKPNEPQPRRDWGAAVAWDDAGRRFQIDGRPIETLAAWDFAAGPAGFQLANAGANHLPGRGLEVTATGPDPLIRSPKPLGLPGAKASLVIVRLTRVKATPRWDGSLHYSTDRHGETPGFMALPLAPPPEAGRPTVLVYDMTAPLAGGRDWVRSKIDQVRIDLDEGAGGEVVIHQIALAREPRR